MILVGKREYKLGNMIMSHMASDSLEELHKMAQLIGIDKRHFQNKVGKPHYDICKEKKALAIKAGANLVDDREIIKLFRNGIKES